MDRKDAHETRIAEVREALASLQKMQAELARDHPSRELAVCDDNSRELIVDERRESAVTSGLGAGVIVLLLLVTGAAVLATFGPTMLPGWAKPYVRSVWVRIGGETTPSQHAVADHLPPLPRWVPSAMPPPTTSETEQPAQTVEETAREDVPAFEERRRPQAGDATRVASLPAPARDLPRPAPIADPGTPAPQLTVPDEPTTEPAPDDGADASPLLRNEPPASLPPPLPPAAAKDVALGEARALFENNQIAAAREKLMAFAPESNPDIAWALARTYDPRHIRSVGGTPADGDISQAEKWYRNWYEVGVAQGLVSKRFRLERLISAMRQ